MELQLLGCVQAADKGFIQPWAEEQRFEHRAGGQVERLHHFMVQGARTFCPRTGLEIIAPVSLGNLACLAHETPDGHLARFVNSLFSPSAPVLGAAPGGNGAAYKPLTPRGLTPRAACPLPQPPQSTGQLHHHKQLSPPPPKTITTQPEDRRLQECGVYSVDG